MTVTAENSRERLLEEYGRWYGEQRFAVAFTSTLQGEDAKRITTEGWDKTAPLATGDFGASFVAGRGKTRNPAIVLRPSNLIVLECDTEDDLLRIEALGLPETITVRSSAQYKRHFYFRPPAELDHLPYVAFRFESGKLTADSGRYFLAPPAIHPSGAVYSFIFDRGPEDTEIATLPAETYHQLAQQARKETAEQRQRLHVDPKAKVHAGQRRDSIFRYACAIRRWTADHDEVLAAALRWNDAHCEPPATRDQVEMQVDGAMKMDGEQELARAIEAPPLPDEPEPPSDDLWHDLDVLPPLEHNGDEPAHPPSPIIVQTWREFADSAELEIPCLVDGLWPESALGFIASPPKKGKTWVGLSLGLSVSLGTACLHEFRASTAHPVLYVALEGHRASLRHRIGSLLRGLDHDPEKEVPGWHVAYKPRGINLADPAWAEHLLNTAMEIEAMLVIVDVLRAAARIKENDASEFAALRSNLTPLLNDGRSIGLLHHFTKTSELSKERTPAERMSGSGAMYGAMDVGVFITGSAHGARDLRLEFDSRDLAVPAPTGARLEGEGTGEYGGFTYADRAWWRPAEIPDEDDLVAPAEEIAQFIKKRGNDVYRTELIELFDVSEDTFDRRRKELPFYGIEERKIANKVCFRARPNDGQTEL